MKNRAIWLLFGFSFGLLTWQYWPWLKTQSLFPSTTPYFREIAREVEKAEENAETGTASYALARRAIARQKQYEETLLTLAEAGYTAQESPFAYARATEIIRTQLDQHSAWEALIMREMIDTDTAFEETEALFLGPAEGAKFDKKNRYFIAEMAQLKEHLLGWQSENETICSRQKQSVTCDPRAF